VQYRIGIDLGTTNCAVAYTEIGAASGETTLLPIPQLEAESSVGTHATLPSFLYLPPRDARRGSPESDWEPGRLARARLAESPGRVIGSAKSWLPHHAADRRARFLPLGSGDVPEEKRLSPVEALARLLKALAEAWDAQRPGAPFREQELAITVPASFDPAAQQLALEAAMLAGLPEGVLLLEEPQAAFYAWMEAACGALDRLLEPGRRGHALVVDIGGGTTDLSLFALERSEGSERPHLERVAVSDHLLLGGDNLDLALAYAIEDRLSPDEELPATAFAQLTARAREIKEEALSSAGQSERRWPVAVALPGASLMKGTLSCEVGAAEIEELLMEGFFPSVEADERPLEAGSGLREMGLPYAKDPAVTRHIAAFLRGRPAIGFVLFNGGVAQAGAIRERIRENVGRWQSGRLPEVLENPAPELAVARGAARFLHLRAAGDASRIEAGSARSYYVGLEGGRGLCVLPRGAAVETPHTSERAGLRALVGRPVSFALYRHERRPEDTPGAVVDLDESGFSRLPPAETVLTLPQGSPLPKEGSLPVAVRATLRSTGLLRLELIGAGKEGQAYPPWPLEFALRGSALDEAPVLAGAPEGRAAPTGGASLDRALRQAAEAMRSAFAGGGGGKKGRRRRLTANQVFAAAEKGLGLPRAKWTGGMARALFDAWTGASEARTKSPEREEVWLHVAGYLLRPGCGAPGDSARVRALGEILGAATKATGKAGVNLQRWIAARRVAAGLDAEAAQAIWTQAEREWEEGKPPPAEVALLAGALETLPPGTRSGLADRLVAALLERPGQVAYWKALGRLHSRVLFHAGAEQVLTPRKVEESWAALRGLELEPAVQREAGAAWLRAARLTDLRPIDVDSACRRQIDAKLRKWSFSEARRLPLKEPLPFGEADAVGLLGESPPPGLRLGVTK